MYGFLSAASETERLAADHHHRRPAVGRSVDRRALLVPRRRGEAEPSARHRHAHARRRRRTATPIDELAFWEQRAKEAGFPIIRVETLTEALVREHLAVAPRRMNVSDEFVRWMLWESAGSPLNIRRVVDYLIAHGYLHWAADRLGRRHGSHPRAAHPRRRRLDPDGESRGAARRRRAVLEAAAVFGEMSSVDLLTHVSDFTPEAHVRAAARARLGSALLDESNDGKTITFPQIHLRDAVYNAMTGAPPHRAASARRRRAGAGAAGGLDAADRTDRVPLRARQREGEGHPLLGRSGRHGHAHDRACRRRPSSIAARSS